MSIIKATREEMDLSRRQLANKLDVNYQTIERWENGQEPPLSKLPIIYKVMKITYKQLVEDYTKGEK